MDISSKSLLRNLILGIIQQVLGYILNAIVVWRVFKKSEPSNHKKRYQNTHEWLEYMSILKKLTILFILCGSLAGLAAAAYFDFYPLLRPVLNWILKLEAIASLVFIALYIAACVLLVPGSILTVGAGVIFGVAKGSILVFIGSLLGANCAFWIGRYAARDWVARKIADYLTLTAIDNGVAREGWKIILLMRLSPAFPDVLINYAFGLTKVKWIDFFWASALGAAPMIVMFVYIGSLIGELAGWGAKERPATSAEWVLYGVGLAATLAVFVYVARLAQKALAARIPNQPLESDGQSCYKSTSKNL